MRTNWTPFWALMKKELRSYFTSPLAYILSAFFLFLLGFVFYNLLLQYVQALDLPAQMGGEKNLLGSLLRPFFGWVNLFMALFCPFVTMRLLAEEKKQKTMTLLRLSLLSESSILIAKFFASFLVLLFMLSLTIIFPLLLVVSGMDYVPLLWTSYVGMVLNIMCYLSLGIFASSLTENQTISVLIGFVLIFVFIIISWFSAGVSNLFLSEGLRYLSLLAHYEGFSLGVIKISDILFYLSFIFFWLFMANLSLERTGDER
ncbi:MAG: ABC transporter permease subunit [Bacteriovoracaceae bacterium]|nr:ABC transporter permease subunit [Bacteriovoracaceae bacterium]